MFKGLFAGEELMALFDARDPEEMEQEREEKRENQRKESYVNFAFIVALAPVLFFFTYIGQTDLGLSVFICLGMNILAIRTCWDLRRRVWFWGIVLLVLALHVPLVLRIKWPHGWVPGISLLPIGLADYLITVGIIRIVEKFVVRFHLGWPRSPGRKFSQ